MLAFYIILAVMFAALFTLGCFQKRDKLLKLYDLAFLIKIAGLLCAIGMCFVQGYNAFDTFWFPLCFSFEFFGFGANTLMNIAFYTIDRSKVDIPIFVLGALGAIGMIIISSICY